MLPTILRRLHEFSRRLVVRVLLIAFCAVLAIVLAKVFGGAIPLGLSDRIGADAVDRILSIIANSMLAVTTFSLTIMAASHRIAQTQWTPRAHQVLLQDTTTHTVLATFVGAYLYAIAVIVLRETAVFQGEELVVLFFVTLAVVALVIIAMIRWISYMEVLGSLIETAGRIEKQADMAYRMRCEHPALGGVPLTGAPPEDTVAVLAEQTGYIQQVYQDRLQEDAEEAGVHVYLDRSVGAFVHRGEVLARVGGTDADCADMVRRHISIGTLRNYTQDPEFGLQNLTEIGQRALSPGINDPGTAVDMIRRVTRILLGASVVREADENILYDRVHVPPLPRDVLVIASIGAILRDGLSHPEVVAAARGSLAALARQGDPAIAGAARNLTAELDEREEEVAFIGGRAQA
ncbi:DUF2254 domain-containing protein [Pseudooceanicola sp.]|uniref:DUF2254 domain-containing protein n=1 Tax=Pseudooceanicola sp. TaxID=1914328 RepID=UPI0035C6BF6C